MYVTATLNLDSTELKEGFIERDDADYSEQYNTGDYGIMTLVLALSSAITLTMSPMCGQFGTGLTIVTTILFRVCTTSSRFKEVKIKKVLP